MASGTIVNPSHCANHCRQVLWASLHDLLFFVGLPEKRIILCVVHGHPLTLNVEWMTVNEKPALEQHLGCTASPFDTILLLAHKILQFI